MNRPDKAADGPLVGAVLAAGSASRYGRPKLLEGLAGRPLLAWPVAAALEAGLDRVLIVTPEDHQALLAALPPDPRLIFLPNPRHRQGMGTSLALAAGRAREMNAAALVVLLGDMPLVRAKVVRAVAEAALGSPAGAAAADRGGRPGHPVAFAARHLPELARLEGDAGGRSLLVRLGPKVALVAAEAECFADVDRPEDLKAIVRQGGMVDP